MSFRPDLAAATAANNPRPAQVVHAAYRLIVDKGIEGFRTRDVATKVGINTATLHYYFPTKEALLQAVVLHLIEQLKKPLVKTPKKPLSALERLRLEFRDALARIRQAPDQILVLSELAIRSWRDPAIARILSQLDEEWRAHLISIFRQGVKERAFWADLEIVPAANALMIQFRGLGLQPELDDAELERAVKQIARQTEHWVMAKHF